MFLPKRHKIKLKNWFYFLKHIHLNWAEYRPSTFYPQSIFPASSSLACQLSKPPNPHYRHTQLFTGSWPQLIHDFPPLSICLISPLTESSNKANTGFFFSLVFLASNIVPSHSGCLIHVCRGLNINALSYQVGMQNLFIFKAKVNINSNLNLSPDKQRWFFLPLSPEHIVQILVVTLIM